MVRHKNTGCLPPPKLISGNEPIGDYQAIFIGSPNWFKTLAPPVMSFLKQHNFTGKTIIPFCTHGGGGFGQIENVIAKECPKSIILPGIAVNGAVTSEEVANWLKAIGFELHHPELGYLNIHPLIINKDGSAKQAAPDGGWYHFEPNWFSCSLFEGRVIPCISAEAQKLFHSGYELREVDRIDMKNLERFFQ